MAAMDDVHGLLARKPIDPAAEAGLKRSLGALGLVGLGIGAIIGAGLFSLTGIAAGQYAGPAVVISFGIAAFGCALTGLCYSEMAAMVPSAGSAYAYAYAALGEAVAWIIGWDLVLEYSVGAATVAVSWSTYVASLLHGWGLDLPRWAGAGGADLLAAGIVAVLSAVLVRGTAESAAVNAVIVVLKVAVVLTVIGVGAFYVRAANYHPFIPPNGGAFGQYGWSGIFRGAGVVFFAYLGFDAVSTTAGEARSPQRTLPIGILGSLLVCTVLYAAFAIVLTGLVPYAELKGDAAPVATAIDHTPFGWLQVVVKLGVIAGFTSVLLVGLLGQSRIVFAMAEDGMLPAVLGRLHRTRKTPWVANLTLMLLTGGLAAFAPIEALAKMTSIGTLLAFAIVCGGVLVLRWREPERERPFRVPFGPVLPALGILVCLALMASLPPATWLRLGAWFAVGAAVYALYAHRRAAAVRANAVTPEAAAPR